MTIFDEIEKKSPVMSSSIITPTKKKISGGPKAKYDPYHVFCRNQKKSS